MSEIESKVKAIIVDKLGVVREGVWYFYSRRQG